MKRLQRGKIGGFTLIEAVTTIVVMSIIGIGVAQFIGDTAAGYLDTSNRNRLSASGRLVIDRMLMELHNALPNSIRVSTALPSGEQCLEFVPVLAATSYIDPPFRPDSASTFEVATIVPELPAGADTHAIIYPYKTAMIYDLDTVGLTAPVLSVTQQPSGTEDLITLDAPHGFSHRSSVRRIYLVDEPVSFCVSGDKVYRYSDYAFHADQPLPPAICPSAPLGCLPETTATGRTVIGTGIDNAGVTAFDFAASTLRRNAVIQIELKLSKAGESINLNHEVFLHSAP